MGAQRREATPVPRHALRGPILGAGWSGHRRAGGHRPGARFRFVVTNFNGQALPLYDQVYRARVEMENQIKEQQLGLFAEGTSAHQSQAIQLRLLLSSLAFMLLESMRRLVSAGSELTRAQVGSLSLQLLMIGAALLRHTRRIRFCCPALIHFKRCSPTAHKS